MNVLAIETSCDETSAAIVADGRRILSNVIASQVDIHARYGGVVPEVASRQHLLSILPVTDEALKKAGLGWPQVDAVAVTHGPGLAGSLLVGVNAAKGIAAGRGLPLTGVNHLEGHIYANWLGEGPQPEFPALCLIVSGGHSDLVMMEGHGQYRRVGRTRDDAAGEAFDKSARIMGVGYPGGPAIEKAARDGRNIIPLTRAWLKGTDDFSFSGIKTAVLHLVEAQRGRPTPQWIADLSCSFQEAVIEMLVSKTMEAAIRLQARNILVAGGVASNRVLAARLKEEAPVPILIPPPILCTDNAAMIASCGYFQLRAGRCSGLELDVLPSLNLG
jgi:N6-L-threonylcarbamoyladenine synthase